LPCVLITHKQAQILTIQKSIMKKSKYFMAIATAASSLLFSCQKDVRGTNAEEAIASKAGKSQAAEENNSVGYVYTLSNQASGNSVLTYSRSVSGTLSYVAAYPTGGNGTGNGLGSQGAVTLANDNTILLAVNPGSNSVTSFCISGGALQWKSSVASGGVMPVSITVHNNLVYVLNAGGSGNISGFRLDAAGKLHALANSTRPLSSANAAAAQISFAQEGAVVVITEKMTNKLISYTITSGGTPGIMHMLASANPRHLALP
jgi:6-phosphogluconolactonase (cycloisomerase 2 family)